ncbi:DUF4870 domain-containing protein [Psychrobacter sp.]|uniref:DUF4870 domain-containing protein n=1 Tax=Psychrobacter sp. TaxID=56811 RepID=UPI0025D1A36B|nr:DUF4870 domain-containing protein [Psychrobacter sp.]
MSNLNKDDFKNNSAMDNNLDSNDGTITRINSMNTVSQDSKNMGLLNWLGCLFTGFIIPLVLLLIKKEDSYIQSQAKEALNMCISMLIAYIGLWILAIIFGVIFAPLAMIPMLFMGIMGLAFFIFCVLGAIKCFSGENFKVPFIIRLLK